MRRGAVQIRGGHGVQVSHPKGGPKGDEARDNEFSISSAERELVLLAVSIISYCVKEPRQTSCTPPACIVFGASMTWESLNVHRNFVV